MKKPLLFMHAPPEHIPHVINASVLYSGLRRVYNIDSNWVTMNVIDTNEILETKHFIQKLKLDELLEYADTKVENCFRYVKDEMNPKEEELEEFILKYNPSVVFVYYFPPFWWPIVQICKKHNIPIGIHVQVNYIKEYRNFIFENVVNAREALIEADYLTVSQQREKIDLAYYLKKDEKNIYVIDKSIPTKVLEEVISGKTDKRFQDEYSHIQSILNNGKKNIGYIGRLDDIKNIHWFLEECMPQLEEVNDKFNLILIGDGNRGDMIEKKSKEYANVHLLKNKLPYKDTLTFLRKLDLVLFPSGYDLTPRLPLEALSVGTRVILGDFNFNEIYKEFSIVVAEGGVEKCKLDYTNYSAKYGIPDRDIMIRKVINFINSTKEDNLIQEKILKNIDPLVNIKSFYQAIKIYLIGD